MSGLRSGRTERAVEHAAKLASQGHGVLFVVASNRQAKDVLPRFGRYGGRVNMTKMRVDFDGAGAVVLASAAYAPKVARRGAFDIVTDHLPIEVGECTLRENKVATVLWKLREYARAPLPDTDDAMAEMVREIERAAAKLGFGLD